MFNSKIFFKAIFIVVSTITIYALAVSFFVIPKIDNSIQTLEKQIAKNTLVEVVSIVEDVKKELKIFEMRALQKHKQELKNMTDIVLSIIQSNYNKITPSTEQEIKKKTIETIKQIRYAFNGYFWINDFSPTMIMHPFKSTLDGKDLSEFKDPNGIYLFKEMVKVSKKSKEGFVKYHWEKPNNDTPQPKISFVKAFEPWNWIIGTGAYIDDIDKEINKRQQRLNKQLNQIIETRKIGKTGYLFIFDKKGDTLFHPNSNIKGKNISKIKLPEQDKFLFDELIKASKSKTKTLYYKWDKPSDKGNYIYDKVSWVEFIPELGWYIGSSAYLQELEQSANDTRIFIMWLSIGILIIAILISFVSLKNLLNPISQLSELALEVTKGNYKVRSSIIQDDEIGILANEFNSMVQTIDDNIVNLEETVKKEVAKNSKKDLQLIQSEKMASMGEMIGNISHQWRQPLSVISSGITGMKLQKNLDVLSDEMFNKTCDIINENAQYLSKTIDDFKNYIKGERILVDFILQETIDSFMHLISSSIKKNNIQIILDIQADLKLQGYPNELIQCLINIINNSKDVLKDIDVNNRYIFITAKIKNKNMILTIKDNAGGINEEILPKVFEPYFTTKHQSKGTGIGLHMTYNLIVDGMKGNIEAQNDIYTYNNFKYTGAKFTITCPIAY